ncbi:MAG: NADH-quinone oxidoreductase subunit L [Planctomycetota bacterium]
MDKATISTLAWIILLAPGVASILITLFTLKNKWLSGFLSVGSIILGAVLSLALMFEFIGRGSGAEAVLSNIEWMTAGSVTFSIGVGVDFTSLLMSCVVTVVGSCIFVYALGYMKGDEGWSRFFAKFAFFAFSMLGITFSTNFAQIFVFWELVGVSSYMLIGYFYQQSHAAEAGKKAFMTNRIGDFGMTLGILMLFWSVMKVFGPGSEHAIEGLDALAFSDLRAIFMDEALRTQLFDAMGWQAWVGALLIFVGAMGKSAQFPLHVWLPDAMAGPTPVSALMHAATMVAAGVYMVVKVFWLFAWSPEALQVIAWIGGITAFLAASIALVQRDIKKILAYSTLSQLGYMVLACGLMGAGAGMFHLTTHAFFKALLFLGAGSVAHACHTYDIFEMGGLWKKMKITAITFWIGTLALAGIFPLAGFWSKDEILAAAHTDAAELGFNATPLYWLAVGVAFMTAFYMGRCNFLTFHGKYRGKAHPHESPPLMWGPLVALSIGAIFVGFIAMPGLHHGLHYYLGLPQASHGLPQWDYEQQHHVFHWSIAILGTVMGVAGLITSFLIYGKKLIDPENLKQKFLPIWTLLDNLYYIDAFYLFLVKKVQQGIAVLANFLEQHIIIGIFVNGIAGGAREAGNRLRMMQTGRVHSYVTMVLAGITILVFWFVVRGN